MMTIQIGPTTPCPHCGALFSWADEDKHKLHGRTGKPRCLRKRPDRTQHGLLVARACRWLSRQRRCKVVFAEPTIAATHSVDAIGWHGTGGAGAGSDVVECKVSLSDLRRERHKGHRRTERSLGNQRWFLVYEEIAERAAEIVDTDFPGWGLLVHRGRSLLVAIVSRYRELPPDAASDERYLLMMACRRHELGVPWDASTRRFEPLGKRQLAQLTTSDEDKVAGTMLDVLDASGSIFG